MLSAAIADIISAKLFIRMASSRKRLRSWSRAAGSQISKSRPSLHNSNSRPDGLNRAGKFSFRITIREPPISITSSRIRDSHVDLLAERQQLYARSSGLSGSNMRIACKIAEPWGFRVLCHGYHIDALPPIIIVPGAPFHRMPARMIHFGGGFLRIHKARNYCFRNSAR